MFSRKLTLAALGLSALVGAVTLGSAPAEAHGYGWGGSRYHGGYGYRPYGYGYRRYYGYRPYGYDHRRHYHYRPYYRW